MIKEIENNSTSNVVQSFYIKIVILLLILVSVIFFRKEIIEMADVAKGVVMSRILKYTVEERISDIENRKPELKKLAEETNGKLEIYVFKFVCIFRPVLQVAV